MDDQQQQYKSHKTIFDLIKKGFNKRMEEINKRIEEKITKEQLEYPIMQLEDLLNKIHKNVREMENLPEIEGSITVINLYKNERSNEPLWEYRIGTHIYNKGNVIGCYSSLQRLPYKIKCINYSNIEFGVFELFDLLQSISFIEGIKNSILNIYNILNPGVLTRMDKQPIHILTYVDIDLNKPIKENPDIYKYKYINKFTYNNDRYYIEMLW
jgi:hypothetical protein